MVELLKGRHDCLEPVSGPLSSNMLVYRYNPFWSLGEQVVDLARENELRLVTNSVGCDTGVGIEEQIPSVLYLLEVARPLAF